MILSYSFKSCTKMVWYWIQDIVPNHMAFDYQNEMLMDVLEHGRRSKYFHSFDITWENSCEEVEGKVLAPFLGRFYGEVLEDGEITLHYGRQGLTVRYSRSGVSG